MLRVIAAAVLDSRRLLLVSKRAAPEVFYRPVASPIPGEAPQDCLLDPARGRAGAGR